MFVCGSTTISNTPEQRMHRLLVSHTSNEFKVSGSVRVDHHRPFNRHVTDTKRSRGKARIEFGCRVFK